MPATAQVFTPEQNFVKKLNSYLANPLGLIGQKRIEEWLKQYREENPPTREVIVRRVIHKTIIKYINGEKPARTYYAARDIIQIVCEYFGIPEEKIKKRDRNRDVILARKYATFFIRKYTPLSLKETAQCFEDATSDHATALHAINTLLDLMDSDVQFKDYMTAIEKKIIESL